MCLVTIPRPVFYLGILVFIILLPLLLLLYSYFNIYISRRVHVLVCSLIVVRVDDLSCVCKLELDTCKDA